jgi:hypothetical protein
MNVIFFTSIDPSVSNRLTRVLDVHVSRKELETCRNFHIFSERLHQPLPDSVVFVLQICSREELMDILPLRELLHDRRIILVLPDSEPETVSLGHILRPRFITYGDSDYMDVSAILGKWGTVFPNDQSNKRGPDKAIIKGGV